MSPAKQWRADVEKRPDNSSDTRRRHPGERKARPVKPKHRRPRARCGQLGHREDDKECPSKVAVGDWEGASDATLIASVGHGTLDTACARTVAGSSCKEYTSYYRKLATETLQLQHEQRQEH